MKIKISLKIIIIIIIIINYLLTPSNPYINFIQNIITAKSKMYGLFSRLIVNSSFANFIYLITIKYISAVILNYIYNKGFNI